MATMTMRQARTARPLVAKTALVVFGLAGCSPSAEPRAQVVVHVDTDLPVVGQLASSPELAADVAVDALRIDVLSSSGAVTQSFLALAPDELDWPVSFGVVRTEQTARLRLRAFRAARATSGEVAGGQTLDPPPRLTVDRLIDLAATGGGVERVHVVIRGDCLGVPATFAPAESCVDDARPHSPPSEGVAVTASIASSLAGTWPAATPMPCNATTPVGRACVPGGVAVLGEDGLAGALTTVLSSFPPSPSRLVSVSAFELDVTEYTVGRLRALLASDPQPLNAPMPFAKDSSSSDWKSCTWSSTSHDDLPLNCVRLATARELCQRAGGDLPTEAQWERAARGHGAGLAHPWGTEASECCTAQLGAGACGVTGPAQAGSHQGQGCARGDVSPDGLLDLAGNVRELVLDEPQPFDGPYWSTPGILSDPVAESPSDRSSVRGASYADAPELARASIRRTFLDDGAAPSIGFRCAYPTGDP